MLELRRDFLSVAGTSDSFFVFFVMTRATFAIDLSREREGCDLLGDEFEELVWFGSESRNL